MDKRYGPYRLLAGRHIEDEPIESVLVKAVDNDRLHMDDGRVFLLVKGAALSHRGEQFSTYIEDRRVAPTELRQGDQVTLAQPVYYRPGDPPFMSMHDLEALHNRGPFSRKFELVGQDVASRDAEIEQLRARVAALEAEKANILATAPIPTQMHETFTSVQATPAAAILPDLDGMTLAQLREHAESEEIDLPARCSREEALRLIRSAR